MNRYGLLGLMGAGAGALAAPEDAEAKARKNLAQIIANAIRNGDQRRFFAGTLEPQAFKDLTNIHFGGDESLSPIKVFLNGHVDSRTFGGPESYLSPEMVGQYWEDLLNGKAVRGARNFPENVRSAGRGKKRGELAIFGQTVDGYTIPFAPLKISKSRWHGKMEPVYEGKTIIETPKGTLHAHLKNTNWAEEVRPNPHLSCSPEQGRGGNYPQLDRLSAVTGSPLLIPLSSSDASVNRQPSNPYLTDGIEPDPSIDPISAIFWGAGLGGGLAKGAASKLLGYAGDLIGGGILDAFETGADAPQEGEPFDDTYGDGILWHMGLKN